METFRMRRWDNSSDLPIQVDFQYLSLDANLGLAAWDVHIRYVESFSKVAPLAQG